MGLSGADANALGYRVTGLPNVDHAECIEDDAAGDLLQELDNAGMLSSADDCEAWYSPVAVGPPTAALIDGYADVTTRITLKDLACFATAALTAKLLLRRFSLESIARRVSLRRARRQAATAPDIDRLQCLVAGFGRMRTFVFTASNECLFDSLALSEFLSFYGAFPRWVFGVRTNPFAAHCWLQHDGIVVNDSPEHVGRFMPIMAI